jgi:predicted transcriptional regulator
MPRPNKDRVMVSFYISRNGKLAVEQLAERLGQSKADTYRQLLKIGLQHAPRSP